MPREKGGKVQAEMARAMTEDQLLNAVRQYARLMGWLTFHVHDSRRSEPGYPDLTLVRGGRLIFAELKKEGGKVTPEQRAWLTELGDVARYSMGNVAVYTWKPSDWHSGEIERRLR
jgi:hypothetical protein